MTNFTSGTTAFKIDQGTASPPAGSTKYLRYRVSANAATNVYIANLFQYRVESYDAATLVGKTVTLSFLVKSSVSRTFNWYSNGVGRVGVDSGGYGSVAFVGGVPGAADLYDGNVANLSANVWTRVSQTFVMNDAGTGFIANGFSLGIGCHYLTVGAETDAELQIAQVMLNEGGPMPFQTAGANFQQELAMCQRYYEKSYDLTIAPGTSFGTTIGFWFFAVDAVSAMGSGSFKVTKRITPTSISLWTNTGTLGSARRDDGVAIVVSYADLSMTGMGRLTSANLFTRGQTFTVHYAVDCEI